MTDWLAKKLGWCILSDVKQLIYEHAQQQTFIQKALELESASLKLSLEKEQKLHKETRSRLDQMSGQNAILTRELRQRDDKKEEAGLPRTLTEAVIAEWESKKASGKS